MEGWEPVVTAALIGWAVTVSLGALSMLIYTLVLLFR